MPLRSSRYGRTPISASFLSSDQSGLRTAGTARGCRSCAPIDGLSLCGPPESLRWWSDVHGLIPVAPTGCLCSARQWRLGSPLTTHTSVAGDIPASILGPDRVMKLLDGRAQAINRFDGYLDVVPNGIKIIALRPASLILFAVTSAAGWLSSFRKFAAPATSKSVRARGDGFELHPIALDRWPSRNFLSFSNSSAIRPSRNAAAFVCGVSIFCNACDNSVRSDSPRRFRRQYSCNDLQPFLYVQDVEHLGY